MVLEDLRLWESLGITLVSLPLDSILGLSQSAHLSFGLIFVLLQVHERVHTGDRPYRCDFPSCAKAFATGIAYGSFAVACDLL